MKPGIFQHSIVKIALVTGLSAFAVNAAGSCGEKIGFQVLGSGGPTTYGERASSSYIVWVNGKSRVLLDAGGGTYARFKASDARQEDLKLIALSHLHADHSVELPAYIKGGYFTDRQQALPIVGPSGAAPFPGIKDFMQRLFNLKVGAFAYLSGTLDGTGGMVHTPIQEVPVESGSRHQVFAEKGLVVYAQGVPHGPVPTLAYRIETPGYTIVYGADQNGDDPDFIDFAQDADLLVMHLAIPEEIKKTELNLHAKPSEIASIAQKSGAKHVLLSHIMPRSERELGRWKGMVEDKTSLPVSIAEDLMCVSREDS